jgi:hypothetical protein
VPFSYCLWMISMALGCAHGQMAHSPTVQASEAANNKTVYVREGASLDLVLHSSYWMIHGSSNPSVLREDGPASLLPAPGGVACPPGVGCRPVKAVFTAELPGTAVVTASRNACGEALRCTPAQRSYKLTVVVTRWQTERPGTARSFAPSASARSC